MTKSYQPPSSSTSSKNPHIEQIIFDRITGLSYVKICFLISLSSKNLDFMVFANKPFKVSTVNFNSTENNSAREVIFHQLTLQTFHP